MSYPSIHRFALCMILGVLLTGCPARMASEGDDSPTGLVETPETEAPACSCVPSETPSPTPRVTPMPSTTPATPFPDEDNDGFAPIEGDCNDHDAQSNPAGCELPLNGRDDDCDGVYDASIGSLTCGQILITGEQPGDKIGYRVQDIGDLDHDGFHDVVVGGIFSHVDAEADVAGRAYLVYGPFGPERAPMIVRIEGASPGEFFGRSAVAVNLVGDRCAELVISAIGYDGQRGRVYVIDGHEMPVSDASTGHRDDSFACVRLMEATLSSAQYQTISGVVQGGRFGDDLLNAGDLDSDGMEDLVISASLESASTGAGELPGAGAAYLFYGRQDKTQIPGSACGADTRFAGTLQGSYFGFSLAGVSLDTESDNRKVLAIGANAAEEATFEGGAVYLYHVPAPPARFGQAMLDSDAPIVLAGAIESEGLGGVLSSSPSLDGDLIEELIVGAPGRNGEAVYEREGGVYLFTGAQLEHALGQASISGTQQMLTTEDAAATWIGSYAWEQLGRGVSFVEDLTGDGIPDILMSVNSTGDDEVVGEGRVFVLSGDPATWPTDEPLIVTNESAEAAFLGEAPDQDAGDSLSGVVGWTGFVVSAPGWDGPGCQDCGAAYFLSLERPTTRADGIP